MQQKLVNIRQSTIGTRIRNVFHSTFFRMPFSGSSLSHVSTSCGSCVFSPTCARTSPFPLRPACPAAGSSVNWSFILQFTIFLTFTSHSSPFEAFQVSGGVSRSRCHPLGACANHIPRMRKRPIGAVPVARCGITNPEARRFNSTTDPNTDLAATSTCTTCRFKEDFSSYWTTNLYYRHPNGSYIRVTLLHSLFYSEGLHILPSWIGPPNARPVHRPAEWRHIGLLRTTDSHPTHPRFCSAQGIVSPAISRSCS